MQEADAFFYKKGIKSDNLSQIFVFSKKSCNFVGEKADERVKG